MIRINLLPVKHSRRQEAARTEVLVTVIGAALLAMLLVLVHVTTVARVNAAEEENRSLTREIERKKEILAEVEQAEQFKADLETKLNVIARLKANKAGPVHLLDQLALATPEKLQLLSMIEEDKKIELTGVAVSNEVISQFLSNLEQSVWFTDVFLNAIDQQEKDGVKLKNFSISARLVVVGDDSDVVEAVDG